MDRLSTAARNSLCRLVALLVLWVNGSSNAFAEVAPYWTIENGPGLSAPIRDGNESRLQADEWQIWLYPLDVSANGGPGRWGLIVGPTATDVRRQLEKAQAFDRRYEHWAGISREQDPQNHFNAFGPIAVIHQDKHSSRVTESLNFLQRLSLLINDLREGNNVTNPLEQSEAIGRAGTVFADYVDALKISQSKVEQLRGTLESNTSTAAWRGALGAAMDDLRQRDILDIATSLDGAVTKFSATGASMVATRSQAGAFRSSFDHPYQPPSPFYGRGTTLVSNGAGTYKETRGCMTNVTCAGVYESNATTTFAVKDVKANASLHYSDILTVSCRKAEPCITQIDLSNETWIYDGTLQHVDPQPRLISKATIQVKNEGDVHALVELINGAGERQPNLAAVEKLHAFVGEMKGRTRSQFEECGTPDNLSSCFNGLKSVR